MPHQQGAALFLLHIAVASNFTSCHIHTHTHTLSVSLSVRIETFIITFEFKNNTQMWIISRKISVGWKISGAKTECNNSNEKWDHNQYVMAWFECTRVCMMWYGVCKHSCLCVSKFTHFHVRVIFIMAFDSRQEIVQQGIHSAVNSCLFSLSLSIHLLTSTFGGGDAKPIK